MTVAASSVAAAGHVAAEALMALVDGELTGAEQRAAEEHVAGCAACADEVAGLREEMSVGRRALGGWGVETVRADVERGVLGRLEDWRRVPSEGAPRMSVSGRASGLASGRAGWWVAGGTGTLAVGAMAMLLVMMSGGRSAAPSRDELLRAEQNPNAFVAENKFGAPAEKAERAAAKDETVQRDAVPSGVAGMLGGAPQAAANVPEPALVADKMLPPPPPPAPPSVAKPSRMSSASAPGRAFSSVRPVAAQVAELDAPMIARTLSLTLTVRDVERSREGLENLLRAYGGYAATMEVSTPEGGVRTLRASLRVPSGAMRGMLAELKGYGKVEDETQSGEEVGQQHADLVARLNTSRASEERLRGILRTRTGDVSEVLEVEQEIARVRGEIEGMEAEQQGLEHRVSYATVELGMDEEGHGPVARTAWSRLAAGARDGWDNALGAVVALMLFVLQYGLAIVVVALLVGVPAWIAWRRWRRVRARW